MRRGPTSWTSCPGGRARRPLERLSRRIAGSEAAYWSVQAGGEVITDALWSYADPLPEATAVRDHVAFSVTASK